MAFKIFHPQEIGSILKNLLSHLHIPCGKLHPTQKFAPSSSDSGASYQKKAEGIDWKVEKFEKKEIGCS